MEHECFTFFFLFQQTAVVAQLCVFRTSSRRGGTGHAYRGSNEAPLTLFAALPWHRFTDYGARFGVIIKFYAE